jgi:predicted lipoprotein with Yx(FWY)xxD motif
MKYFHKEIAMFRTVFSMLAAVLLTLSFTAIAQPKPAMKAADGTLTNAAGMTLYVFDRDASGKSACNGPCTVNWPPLMVVGDGAAAGDWTIIVRDDGTKQWAFKGKPLYTWSKDAKPGDKTGDGVNSVWHVAKD